MSVAYDLYCQDCKETAGFYEFASSNGLHNIRIKLFKYASAVQLESEIESIKLAENDCQMPKNFLSWCKRHLNHNVVVRDEYGHCQDKCHKQIKCPTCGKWTNCCMPSNHEDSCVIIKNT